MEKSLGDVLKATTYQAKALKSQEDYERSSRLRRQEQADVEDEQQEIEAFVRFKIDYTTNWITGDAHDQANRGHSSSETIWNLRQDHSGQLPVQEIERHRALRDRAIEHFSDMGVVATSIDHPLIEHDFYRPAVTDEDMPAKIIGHVIGVRLSWEEPTTPSEVREHLNADKWLNQGQASSL